MALTEKEIEFRARQLLDIRESERPRLDRIHAYLANEQEDLWLPRAAPAEVRELARISHVNFLDYVVNNVTQSLYVDGYRAKHGADDSPTWDIWQRNRMDSRQIGIHRAAVTYGAAYVVVLPGDPVPVIRGASPRNMTVAYGLDDEWPEMALWKRTDGTYRLLDETSVYDFVLEGDSGEKFRLLRTFAHSAGVCPVVRFRETDDLDTPVLGEVEPRFKLQDQINVTTFELLVAQHYGAFRQRWIMGWVAEDEQQKLQASASKLWTFEDSPQDIAVGEFSQTNTSGYIESREATLRHLATVSQTPAHELLGQLVNLSADALAAANDSNRRKITERQTVLGESHEQVLDLAGSLMGLTTDPSAYVRWKDTEPRSLAQTADALGKLVQMLGVPDQELWEMIPGVTQQEITRWKAAAAAEKETAEADTDEAPLPDMGVNDR